ncbi:type VI secretion system baseplate subunit TssG [Cesiribacter sp. SM1]|uniref:type VI secretion system baseplate subunit TssG n=1 Tax=Cesiribacter sp. SM1 TaxID=2861196 RepID=UPI001CD5E84E|nr:type VI secretion system baseplate subunit TssG [Cesiribacter sp. SM1]
MYQGEDDYRAEALIAFWLENEVLSLDNLTIQPEGTFQRPYSKDVLAIERGEKAPGSQVKLRISREGLYDMLPEGLFHQAEQKTQKSTEEAVKESERYEREEAAARRMFLPLEQEFYRQRIWLEHTELQACLNTVRPENESFFMNFWGIDKKAFTPQQSLNLLAVLPHLHEVVGDQELVAFCLEKIIQEPVSIAYTQQQEELPEGQGVSLLGNVSLGVDVVLGGSWWADEPAIEVTVGPIAAEKLPRFLPEGKTYKQIKKLYGYFFPAEASVITNVAIEKAGTGFKLVAENMHAGRLGYTTEI